MRLTVVDFHASFQGTKQGIADMIRVIGFASACLLLATPVSAAEFIGTLKVLTGNAGCNDGWNPAGGEFNGLLYPLSANPSENYSQFSIFDRVWTMGLRVSNTNFGATLKNAATTVVGKGIGSFTSKISFSSQAPSTIVATSKFVSVSGQIAGFDANPDCTITFRFSGVLR
jgi:hypothetical protein